MHQAGMTHDKTIARSATDTIFVSTSWLYIQHDALCLRGSVDRAPSLKRVFGACSNVLTVWRTASGQRPRTLTGALRFYRTTRVGYGGRRKLACQSDTCERSTQMSDAGEVKRHRSMVTPHVMNAPMLQFKAALSPCPCGVRELVPVGARICTLNLEGGIADTPRCWTRHRTRHLGMQKRGACLI